MGASSGNRAATSRVAERALDVRLFEKLTDAREATTDLARARLLGIDRMTIYRWRNRRNGVGMETATRVAAALEVGIDELFPVAS